MDCCSRLQISTPAPVRASPTPSSGLSIRSIARLYAGEEILVTPISWTGRQLELLGCSFSDPILAPSHTALEFPPEHDGYAMVKEYLRHWWGYGHRQFCISKLLTAPECLLRASTGGTLHFNGISKRLYCSILYLQDDDAAPDKQKQPQPVAAYTDLDYFWHKRMDTLRCYEYNPRNGPLEAIRRKKLKKLRPSEELHDPYIAALLIAVAQEKRKSSLKANPTVRLQNPQEQTFQSQVICSLETDECIYLYTADISSFLLDMFDDSSVSPPKQISVSIQMQKVPFDPPQTFRARLLTLLCPTPPIKGEKRNLHGDITDSSPSSKLARIS